MSTQDGGLRTIGRCATAVAIALPLLAACATSSGRSPALLSSWKPPAPQTCTYNEPEGGIPPVDAFVDSAGLHAAVAELWARTGADRGRALFSVTLGADSTKTQRPPGMIEDELPPEIAAELVALLVEHLRGPQPGNDRVRLEIAFDSGPRFRAGGWQACKPALRNEGHVQKMLNDFARTAGVSGAALVQVYIDTRGIVRRTRLHASSGNERVNRLALEVAREMQFHPALNDRVPVPVWVTMPIRVTVR